jgi:hypothetical protein
MDDYPDQLLSKVRYWSHMYWKGKISADEALLAFVELDEWLSSGGCGPSDWEGML